MDTVDRPRVTTDLARLFAVGLGLVRLGWGGVQVVTPGLFARAIGVDGAASSPVAWRMKGGRDIALGLAALMADRRDDVQLLALVSAAAVVVDGVDGVAVHADAGRALRWPVHPWGAWLGYGVAATAAVAAAVLSAGQRAGRRETSST